MDSSNDKIAVGDKIGYWTVVSLAPKGKGGVKQWHCICECGKERDVMEARLKNGTSRSCGCHRFDKRKQRAFSRDSNGKHTRLYGRWANIKDRCCNPNCKDYHKYGGRGITICDEWKNDYIAFKNWAESNGYSDELQIDRIDNNRGYSPDNCRFVTPKCNSNNRRSSIVVLFKGEKKTVMEVAESTGIPWPTLYKHIREGSLDEYVEKRAK